MTPTRPLQTIPMLHLTSLQPCQVRCIPPSAIVSSPFAKFCWAGETGKGGR
ncbi:BQ5605_C003g02072 [Microbotryum silenes-dioicae]|uniref:BQ5605_C003g02072 protein n=1 Tax=Microbotryum silenes-dioicae TaxID=796604 RepID=A0A2X0M4X4_9BASI|nr:BQ5605_C003g02072 [Microbotryum silenes-dioicae]